MNSILRSVLFGAVIAIALISGGAVNAQIPTPDPLDLGGTGTSSACDCSVYENMNLADTEAAIEDLEDLRDFYEGRIATIQAVLDDKYDELDAYIDATIAQWGPDQSQWPSSAIDYIDNLHFGISISENNIGDKQVLLDEVLCKLNCATVRWYFLFFINGVVVPIVVP